MCREATRRCVCCGVVKVEGLAAESGRATAAGHGGAAARCLIAAAQGAKREKERVEKVEEVKEGRRHSAMRQSEEPSRGRAARDGAAPPPPSDHTAPSREAEGSRRRIAFRLQALMAAF